MPRTWVAWVVVLTSCVRSASVPCGELTCPPNTVCEPTRLLCILPEQQTVCVEQGLDDGAQCEARDKAGICQDALCLPGCGDGATNDPEECDDANFASHDGCSSTCRVESPVWQPFVDEWRPIQRHVAAYHAGLQRLVVVTGISEGGPITRQWHHDPAMAGTAAQGWITAEADLGLPNAIATPPARTGSAMVYDSARARLVLFGGVADGLLADTWEYDTSSHTWIMRTPSMSPPARFRHSMVFDPTRNRVVLFGGTGPMDESFGDTWEYDGSTWAPIVTTPAPAARSITAMTWDSARNVAVLFGGVDSSTTYDDTWEYANGTWQSIATATTPPRRRDHAMAYFPAIQRTMLFGGAIPGFASGSASDLWEYDGATWVEVSTPVRPPGRRATTLTAVGDTLLLVGGTINFNSVPFEDVWELSTTRKWTVVSPRFEPQLRTGPIAYDEANRELIALAGSPITADYEQWSFDGTAWTDATDRAPAPPEVGIDFSTSYDPVRKRVIVFGGFEDAGAGPAALSRTYELDGNSLVWTQVPGSWPPALARINAAMAYDGQTQRTIVFGGHDSTATYKSDTWSFDGTTWTFQAQATGPASSQSPAAAWDAKHERLVLVDNAGGTFAYDHGTWVPIAQTGDRPGARFGAAMTYDWQRERVLLVGGQTAQRDFFDEVWELDGDTWTKLDIQGGSALPRSYFGLASHRWGRKTVLFGGTDGGGLAADTTWFFQYVSETPDENCTDTVDDDGDLQPDAVDPDCTRRAQ